MFSTSHLHPMLVHFPIALVMFGFIADLASIFIKKEVCLSRAGFYLLLIGTLSAAAAAISGAIFTDEKSGTAGQVQETHEMFAIITICILVIASAIRIYMEMKKTDAIKLRWTFMALYGLGAISVSITGFFGGTLVYNYMMPL